MDNDEQMIVVRLDSDALAPHLARVAIQEALSEQPADLRDIAVLLADEIVTNAVVHCGGRIEMSLEESPRGFVLRYRTLRPCFHWFVHPQPVGKGAEGC